MILQMHTSALKSVQESANPRMDSECASGCTWSTARATARLRDGRPPGVVQQDKSSGGSIDTTKTRSGPRRVRLSSGERPIGAAKGKQSDTEALCQNPPHRPCRSASARPSSTSPRGSRFCTTITQSASDRRCGPGQCASHPVGRGAARRALQPRQRRVGMADPNTAAPCEGQRQ